MNKRLYRSQQNKVFGGVCGGLGEYFEIDPVLVRIIAVLLVLAPGIGLLAYIIGWVIIPLRPKDIVVTEVDYQFSSWNKYLPGLILIGIGVILLVRENWYWFDWDEFWPIALILVGLVLIFRRKPKESTTENTADLKSNGEVPHNGSSSL